MKKLFAIISLFALVLTSCEKEETIVIGSNFDTITATIESAADTKAALQNGTNTMNVVWESCDYISIFFKIGDVVKNVKYHLSSGDGTNTGTFEKAENVDLTNAEFLATVYPYTQNAAYDAATKTISGLTMAASYQYDPNKMTTQAPMAYVGSVNTISFKNAASLVQVTTSNVPSDYTSVVLSSTASKLSGNYKISFNNNNEPVATLTGDNSNGSTVTFTGTGADQTIYFPILPESYSDLAVTLNGTNVVPIELIAPRELVAARNNCYYTSIPVTTMTETTVELTNSYTTQEDIQILDFTNVTTGDITVTGNSVTDKITIVATNESSTPRALNIELPSATVEVTGSSTYSTITASTAENTLILGDGVNVTKVIVNKGNIRVNNGAVLNGIQLGTDVSSVKVIDNGGTIANAVKNTSGVTVITGLEADIAAAEDGETVYMTQDVTLDNILTIDKNITLDGNGFTLTSTATRAINVGKSGSGDLNVTIKNLTINASGERAINIIQGVNGHNVTIENVIASASNYTVNVAASAPNSKVTITESELTGLNTINIGANNTTMTVSDSELTTNDNSPSEGYGTITVSSYNPENSTFLSGSKVSVDNCNFNIGGTQINETYNVSYASSLNEVEIISSIPAQLSIEDVKAILHESSTNYYAASTLDELIEKANGGKSIILVDHVTITEPVEIDTDAIFTIDLNSKTLKTAEVLDADNWSAAIIVKKGNVTIKGGTIETQGTAGHKKMGAIWVRGSESATVTITDGTYKGNSWDTEATYTDDCMATIYVSNANGKVNINGGNFYCVQQDQTTGFNHILNYTNSFVDQKIFVEGGKFYRMDPAVGNGTEQTYLKQGYTSSETTENDIKVFTVSATENI